MRYEVPSFRIDRRDFLKGNNSYDNYPEGAFLASSVGMNSFSKPGLLSIQPTLGTAKNTTSGSKGAIGFAQGPLTLVALLQDSGNTGTLKTVTQSTGVFDASASAGSGLAVVLGQADIVYYSSYFYTTSSGYVGQFDDSLSGDGAWWDSQTDTRTATTPAAMSSGYPHPMLVYESILYIADGRYLHKIDGTTVTTQVFDIAVDYIITAICEYNGLIYITASPHVNTFGTTTTHGKSKLFTWDGLLESWLDEYDLDYFVSAMKVYKNRLYMWTNKFMGLWTGSEISPLFPVSNATVYKCHITANSDSLIWVDGPQIIRWGAPFIRGIQTAFYKYLSTNQVAFAGILSYSDDNLWVADRRAGTSESYSYLISNINTPDSSGSVTLELNPRYMKVPVKVKAIVVETLALASGHRIRAGYVDDTNGNPIFPAYNSGEFKYATTTMQGKTFYRFDVSGKRATRSIRPYIILDGNIYVRSIDYLYENSESKQNA